MAFDAELLELLALEESWGLTGTVAVSMLIRGTTPCSERSMYAVMPPPTSTARIKTMIMMRFLILRPEVDLRISSSMDTGGLSNIVLSSIAWGSSSGSPAPLAEESSAWVVTAPVAGTEDAVDVTVVGAADPDGDAVAEACGWGD